MSNFPQVTMRELTQIARLNLSRMNNLGPDGKPREEDRWQPMVVIGPPGCGKSYFGRMVLPGLYAEAMGGDPSKAGYYEIKPAERDGVEVAGITLPMESEDGEVFTQFTVSPVIKGIEAMRAAGYEYIVLLIDELAAAGIPEQKVLSSLLDMLEHAIGGNKLTGNVIVYATGNRAQDKAGAMKILSHLLNRAKFFELRRDVNAWAKDYAEPHGINPIMVECVLAYADDGFLADSVPVEQTTYCTERSITMAAADLDAFMATPEFTGFIPRWVESMLAANIGEVSAKRVVDWVAQRGQVPTAEEIMRDPEGAQVPEQTGFQMIAANIAMAEVKDSRTATAALHYIMRLRKDLQISLGVKLMNVAASQGMVMTDPSAAAFVSQFHEYLPLAQAALNNQ